MGNIQSIEDREQHQTGIRFRQLLRDRVHMSAARRPRFFSAPFSVDLFRSGSHADLDALTIEAMPEITYYTDTHLVAPQLVSEGYDTLSSGKRRFFGLSKNKSILRNVRMLDDISYIMLRQIGPHLVKRYREGGLVVHGGDIIDSYEAGNCFRTFAELERFHTALYAQAASVPSSSRGKPEGTVQTRSIWITGNHDTFFGGLEKWFEYNQLRHQYGDFSPRSFRAVVTALKSGCTWHEISAAWEASHTRTTVLGKPHRVQRALHPAYRWYLERLTFGPAQGRFVRRQTDGSIAMAVYFLDSELMTLHGGVNTLRRALKEVGFKRSDMLYQEMVGFRAHEQAAQAQLIAALHHGLQHGVKPIVYAHNPRQIQSELRERIAGLAGVDPQADSMRRLIEDEVMIYGGHYHTAGHDIVHMPSGVQPVRGATRLFIGPFGQRPGRFPFTLSIEKYLGSLAPEILEGPLNAPHLVKVAGVQEAFTSALELAE